MTTTSVGESYLRRALMREGFDAEIVRTTVEDGSMVVLFTIESTTGKRLAMTAYITARAGCPPGGLDPRPRIEIFEGFV